MNGFWMFMIWLAGVSTGYSISSIRFRRQLQKGYHTLALMVRAGYIPEASDVIKAFGGEVVDQR